MPLARLARALCAISVDGLFWGFTVQAQSLPNLFPFPNSSGLLETYNAGGASIDLTGPFFQSLGTNGRSCSSCPTSNQNLMS